MARPLRIERVGSWYHITCRGNERRPIYRQDQDRRHFCSLLRELVERFRICLHAYVLMDNHFHLLIQISELNLSVTMQWLNLSYSVWFNRGYGRSGHLFQGRYKAVVVDPREWAVGLSVYLHLNPVRVGRLGLSKREQQRSRAIGKAEVDRVAIAERIERLREYRWSSYRAYIGLERCPDWLERQTVLNWSGGKGARAGRLRYREHVESKVREGLLASPWEELRAQAVLGSEEFLREVIGQVSGNKREQGALRQLEKRPSLAAVIAAVEKVKGEKWAEFRDRYGDWGRDVVMHLGRRVSGMKLGELGSAVGGIDYVTVSNGVRRLERKMEGNPQLRRFVEKVALNWRMKRCDPTNDPKRIYKDG